MHVYSCMFMYVYTYLTHPRELFQGPQRSAWIPFSKIIINNKTVNKETHPALLTKSSRPQFGQDTRFKPSKIRASMYTWIYVHSCMCVSWWTTHKKPTQITNKSFFVYMNICIFIYMNICIFMYVCTVDRQHTRKPTQNTRYHGYNLYLKTPWIASSLLQMIPFFL